MSIPYKNFSNYILRSPQLSVNFYKELTGEKYISDTKIKALFEEPIIKEALFLATPSFYNEVKKWVEGEELETEKANKLKYSFLKYVSRMSSRCTPFGLFAGCSVGEFSDETALELNGAVNNKRHTSLDMNFLVSFAQELVKIEKIRKQIKFFPNTSLYQIGDELRYVEYQYIRAMRKHQISEVEGNEYLNQILGLAKEGALLNDLAKSLVDEEVTFEEAAQFIHELVDNQLLISELEPSLSGPEFLEQILTVLEQLHDIDDILKQIYVVKNGLETIDQNIGNAPQYYIDLYDELKKIKKDYDPKFLFQADLALKTKRNTIDVSCVNDIKKGLKLLNRLTIPVQETVLNNFKKAFRERYETREVELAKVLDLEMGIGYRQNQGSGDSSPLIDQFFLPPNMEVNYRKDIKWSTINMLFQKKLMEAYKNDDYVMKLEEDEFKKYDAKWNDFPDTMSFMVQMLKIDGQDKIQFTGGGGSSAVNLIGRFCFSDDAINTYANHITETEDEMIGDKLLAEIVHLPESRVGNILMRPMLRQFEIPYLAKSLKSEEKQLPIDDLMISIKNNGRIVLRSKKYNKEVIPRLANAHNYSQNALPIYHFLSDMQTQDLRGGVGFSFGPFAEEYQFLPRVEYKNLIIKEATWNLKKEDVTPLLKKKDDELWEALKVFRKKWKLPQFVTLVDGDNKLLINLENLDTVKMWLTTVNKRPQFKFNEFLFSEDGIVQHNGEYYTNQVIVSFYNENKLTSNAK